MKKIFFIILCLTVPINLNATLWNYSANGTIERSNNHKIFNVSGNMIIDDTLILLSGSFENGQFSYDIPNYSLQIGENSFFGSTGNLYMEKTDSGMGDLMWFLEDGSGDWSSCIGEHFNFYHEDMTPCDLFNEWDNLAPIIQLLNIDYMFYDQILGGCDNLNTDIILTRNRPVPEPATMLLLGTGLIGVGILGRKRFKK